VEFRDGMVTVAAERLTWDAAVEACYLARVSLTSTGFYATPDLEWDRLRGKGRPFFYFAYGCAVTEVVIDTLTGENRILRADVLHDCRALAEPGARHRADRRRLRPGRRLAYHRGVGLGRQGAAAHPCAVHLQDSGCVRRPAVFNVALWDGENPSDTIYRSKAVASRR
jgi:xanthine dehydrogenase large subunit